MEKANRIIVLNSLCLTSALLAFSFSLLIFFASPDIGVLIAGLAESLIFGLFIRLNVKGRHPATAAAYLLIHNLALVYFAIFRQMVVEELLLVGFLVICSLLTLSKGWQILVSIGASLSILLFAIANARFHLLPVSEMDPQAMGPFHNLGTIALVILITVTVGHFKWREEKFIATLHERNQTLEAKVRLRTRELEAANSNLHFFHNQFSHDTRDNLHAMLNMNELLLQALANGDKEAATYAKHLQIAIAAMVNMASDILTVKLIEQGQHDNLFMQTVETRKWLEDFVEVSRYNAEVRKVKVLTSFEEPLPFCLETDVVKLERIIGNLLANAIRHARSQVVFKVFATVNYMIFELKDNGPGIAPEKRQKIFEKNYTTGSGTGLGLYIVRWLCVLMHIELKLESTEGKGTSFFLKVPIREGDPRKLARAAEAEDIIAESLKGKKVLIADDSVTNRLLLRHQLQKVGCMVFEAEDGAALLALASRQLPDLIIMDNQMPVMGGFEALKRLRVTEKLSSIPVIMMSAEKEILESEKQSGVEADHYEYKPVRSGLLLLAMARLLEGKAVQQGEDGE